MAFSDPEHNIEQFKLGEDMRVADLGSGSGAYTLAAARRVKSGKVYAVEIQRELLSKVQNGAREANLHNVEIVWGDLEKLGGSKLGDVSMDAVIISNIIFQIADKVTFLKEAYRILRQRGKVLFIEWSDSFGGLGPAGDDIVREAVAKDLFEKTGFSFEEQVNAGDHHYGMIFRKQ